MRRTDWARVAMAGIMPVLGLVIIVRAVASGALTMVILGVLFVALGVYRLRQYLQYRANQPR
ncbi:MAG TPA: hypothetical protein VFB34_01420 [Chloroflexota bacterium]|nr:hypothetical protein [Chloroflexota bacterium]